MPKAQVANLIAKVENGVDEFRKYLDRKRECTKYGLYRTGAGAGKAKRTASESQKATANAKKDELDDALGDLNRSTNRLRRKFDPTDKWMETKPQVEKMLDDGRRINQAVARGNYGSEVAGLSATLRTGVNELARAYGCAPSAI